MFGLGFGRGLAVGFVWVGVWPGFGGWICLGWGLAGFDLSWIFGCGGCGGGCWLLAGVVDCVDEKEILF